MGGEGHVAGIGERKQRALHVGNNPPAAALAGILPLQHRQQRVVPGDLLVTLVRAPVYVLSLYRNHGIGERRIIEGKGVPNHILAMLLRSEGTVGLRLRPPAPGQQKNEAERARDTGQTRHARFPRKSRPASPRTGLPTISPASKQQIGVDISCATHSRRPDTWISLRPNF